MRNIKPEDIPCPRLEFDWIAMDPSDRYDYKCFYRLVLPLREGDIRRDFNPPRTELAVEIGWTGAWRTYPPLDKEGFVDVPFRDGAHARWDRNALGDHLPIVAIFEDHVTLVEEDFMW